MVHAMISFEFDRFHEHSQMAEVLEVAHRNVRVNAQQHHFVLSCTSHPHPMSKRGRAH